MSTATLDDWMEVIRAEYEEIPGLNLTRPQIQRLWGLSEEESKELIDRLIEQHVLRCTRNDQYVRADMEY